MGPPMVVSRSEDSRIARSRAVAASTARGGTPRMPMYQRLRLEETRFVRNPSLRHNCGSVGFLPQIIIWPLENPAEKSRTFELFLTGNPNITPYRISSTGL